MKKIKPLQVTKLALNEYRFNTINNLHLSKKEVAKKLTRNILLAYPMNIDDVNYRWYAYGRLRILVKNNKKIISVINRQETIPSWKLDEKRKAKLDKMFGLL